MEKDLLEPIAVVGLSLKFPQDAVSPDGFWKLMKEKRCAMTEWPSDRLNIDAFHHADKDRPNTIRPRGAHFMEEDVAAFDASFFSITAAEARAMDPQQRLLLETAITNIYAAGISLEMAAGSNTGVYVGSMDGGYSNIILKTIENTPKYASTGVSSANLANRLSWFFDFGGPSIHLDSACSSSLMALDIAVQGLRNGDSEMAVVAGSSMCYGVEGSLMLSSLGLLSPDSRCYSFDHRANGYARGEGVGIVILKKLSDAIRSNDTIRAVVRATGSNSDGHTPGLTQPSKDAQERLIRDTYKKAGLEFGETKFFEAHGTGTPVGDPIEAKAIANSNIGHLEGASGVAALIKTVLVLERGVIPPNANFERLNPVIAAFSSNLKFPQEVTPWPTRGLRRASVNSFGFGGSNAHCIVEDAYHFLAARSLVANHSSVRDPPALELPNGITNGITNGANSWGSTPKLLVWSAADEGGLARLSEVYDAYFKKALGTSHITDSYLENLAFTLGHRRSVLPWKSFAIADTPDSLQEYKNLISKPVRSSKNLGIAFVFTGQGAQYSQMGADLVKFPVFQKTLELVDAVFRDLGAEWSLFEELRRVKGSSNIDSPVYSQPICTALQIGLVELLKSVGIQPSVVVAHSSGEIAAAYAAGGLSLESACKVSYYRGLVAGALRAASSQSPGAMMSVNLAEAEVDSYLKTIKDLPNPQKVTVACINSPLNVTISGSEADLDIIQRQLDTDQVFARKVQTGLAYHSLQMEKVASQYQKLLQDIEPRQDSQSPIAMVSSVTGEVITDTDILSTAEYWVKNMVQPVKFHQAISHVMQPTQNNAKKKLGGTKAPWNIYDIVEIGPHSVLQRPISDTKQILKLKHGIRYQSVLSRNKSPLQSALEVAGKLYLLGYPVDLESINQPVHNQETRLKVLSDLPEYPFDHSRRYWFEGRISQSVRLREHGTNDFLGTPSSDWNSLEARWSKIFDRVQMPWVEDHRINGQLLFPATGMLVMVLEAAKQTALKDRVITGFQLQDVIISNPIVIPDHDGNPEAQLYLRPLPNTFDRNCPSSEFRLCVYEDNGQWRDVCKGVIMIEYQSANPDAQQLREVEARQDHCKLKLEKRIGQCDRHVDTTHYYASLRKMGFEFGPSFMSLNKIAYDGGTHAVAEVDTFGWAARTNHEFIQPHIIHPITLDAIAQASWIPVTSGGTKIISTAIPHRIRNAWISASGLGYPGTNKLQLCTTSWHEPQGIASNTYAMDEAGELKVVITRLEGNTVSIQQDSCHVDSARQLCYGIGWKPDVSLMSPEQILDRYKTASKNDSKELEFFQDLDVVLYSYIVMTLKEVDESEVEKARPHLQKHVAALRLHVEQFKANELCSSNLRQFEIWADIEVLEKLADRVETANSMGKLHVTVARNLGSIVRGTIDPLELIFSNNLAEEYYRAVFNIGSYCGDVAKYLDALAHKNPVMKILEVGAGTGGFTDILMPTLLHHDEMDSISPRFSSYDYTDISGTFMEKASERLASLSEKIHFKVLHIGNEPASQGFEPQTYDLIIAGSVLHATSNLGLSLQNCRKLLKPGGKLIMLEPVKPVMRAGFSFGILPGWWLATENFRQSSPCISTDAWDNVLKENGFSGVDIEIQDYENEASEFSIIVSTATKATETAQKNRPRVYIIVDADSQLQNDVARDIMSQLSTENSEVEMLQLSEISGINNPKSAFFIFLPELERSFLYELPESDFVLLKLMTDVAQNLLWVTHAPGNHLESIKFAMIDGLTRTWRSEDNNRTIVTLRLEDAERNVNDWSKTILKVLEATTSQPSETMELEYIQRDGTLLISRAIEANYLDEEIYAKSAPRMKELELQDAGPVALTIGTRGLLDTLHFIADEEYSRALPDDHVEVQIKYLGLNFRDVLVALGRLNASELGAEAAGFVTRVGASCQSLKPGDRVCLAKLGCMRTHVSVHERSIFKIPVDMPLENAASLIVVGATAYLSFVETARLRKGEYVLIHSASGATGQMAIQLAQHFRCKIFATVGSPEKKKLLKDLYNIPEDHIFYSRNRAFATSIKRMTKGRGVDVVLNSLSGEGLTASWELIAPYGRFIEIGKADILTNSRLPMACFANNVSFSAIAIDHYLVHRPTAFADLVRRTLDMFGKKILQIPQPLHFYPISKLEEGMRFMQSGESSGKIVFSLAATDRVPAIISSKPQYQLDPNASYLISGGFGGLGRSAAFWMATRGAKYLILLSRSGPKIDAAIKLVEKLQHMGVSVATPKCDVSSAENLSSVLSECAKTMPPIQGCIQSAMVLKDALFDKMTHEEWTTSIRAKVYSTWNLHNLLPSDLKFFIELSSLSGIAGTIGQSNYAAGNTFQDALALHRISQGQKAVSLRLGLMSDIGVIAENDDYKKSREGLIEMARITEAEFVALLEYYCDPSRDVLSPLKGLPLIGLVTPAQLHSQGMDVPSWLTSRSFNQIASRGATSSLGLSGSSASIAANYASALRKATTIMEAQDIFLEAIVVKLSRALAVPSVDIDITKPFHAYGVDSLLAVELRNWFGKELGSDVAVFDIMATESIAMMSRSLAGKSSMVNLGVVDGKSDE
ncbi:BcPKS1, polyketide synthase [Stipitochalara longipes BDJ]|nr:BcPKS1, polyketide synthase [Stipitochalara longipes BDJ]